MQRTREPAQPRPGRSALVSEASQDRYNRSCCGNAPDSRRRYAPMTVRGSVLKGCLPCGEPMGRRGVRLPVCLQEFVAPSLRSEEHTSELQSQSNLVCRLLLEKKKPAVLQGPVAMLETATRARTAIGPWLLVIPFADGRFFSPFSPSRRRPVGT